MVTSVGSPPPACSYIAARVCCGGVQSVVGGSTGEGGGKSGQLRANSALTSPFSLFALSYGLERHAARGPRTTKFLDPGGVLLQRSGEPRGRRRRLGPILARTTTSARDRDESSLPTTSPTPGPGATASKECVPTRGRTCGRRATQLSLHPGTRLDESQRLLPLYTSLTGSGREV